MADSRGPTLMIGNKQLAMSKALGAAFLTHQVEQLEKSTTTASGWRRDGGRNPPGRGAGPRTANPRQGQGNVCTPNSPPKDTARRKPSSDRIVGDIQIQRRSNGPPVKEADIIVADASVLVHCINQFKAWCKDGREETIVVPLEALNTLDLLKKGITPLAQRARAASRILEAQVGTNDRIQVQSDAAFVLWDKIPFADSADADKTTEAASPEWVRRTICCAQYENDQAESKESQTSGKKVVIAIAQAPAQAPSSTKNSNDVSSPVPLPAPQQTATSKYEPRATGSLVRTWATRAGLQVLEVKATPLPADEPTNRRERSPVAPNNISNNGPGRSPGRARRADHGGSFSGNRGPINNGNGSLVERPAAVQTVMNMVNKPSGGIRLLARGEKLEP